MFRLRVDSRRALLVQLSVTYLFFSALFRSTVILLSQYSYCCYYLGRLLLLSITVDFLSPS